MMKIVFRTIAYKNAAVTAAGYVIIMSLLFVCFLVLLLLISYFYSESYFSYINSFSTNVPLLYPLKTSENLRFSGGIEVEHWLKMGKIFT